uniref:(northern house mosquito) hypothetical protein n=1 Tax=Culex pipiens TaxID=7175 RepID=A0A8D8NY59_CULPI
MGSHSIPPAASSTGIQGPTSLRRRETHHQRVRPTLRDLANDRREVPGHAARLERAGLFLRRVHEGVLLRPRSGHLPAHTELLPHRQAPLPAARVSPELR